MHDRPRSTGARSGPALLSAYVCRTASNAQARDSGLAHLVSAVLSAGIDDGRKGESEQVMREGSMEIAEIEQVVKPILARELGVDVASIGDDTNVDNMPLWDSVKHVDIVFAIQDAFALEFHPREIDEMYSYPEIMETLVRRLITAPGEVRDFSR